MKKIKFPFYLLFLFLCNSFLFSQSNPIVQVDPVLNLSDEVWLDAVCDAATDNVLFTLKFLGQFEVMSDLFVGNIELIDQETFDTSSLKSRAETEGYDNILFGSCTIEDGSYVITMNAYDLALDKITYSGSTVVESIFDTFEAVDEITYQTVEGFSGIHVTYGSLVLVPPNTGEPFSFTIDGIALPEGTFSVERMPAGVHELAIWQDRPFGVYETVHDIEVVEEKENRIDIPLPNIVGEEIAVFSQADRYLTLLSMGKETDVVLAMNNLNSLLETSFFLDFRSDLVEKYKTWVVKLEGKINYLDKLERFSVSQYIKPFWNSEIHQLVFNNTVSLSSQYATLFLNQEQLKAKNIFVPAIKTIKVDGKADDWGNVSTVFKDRTDDFSKGYEKGKGQDIAWVGVAVDENRLYFAMETVSKIYRDDRFYIMEINIGDLLNLRYDGSDKVFKAALVRNVDWDNSKWFDSGNSLLRGRKNEIVEISFPWNQVEKWLNTNTGVCTFNFFIQRSSAPYYNVDTFSFKSFLPSIYNAFKLIKKKPDLKVGMVTDSRSYDDSWVNQEAWNGVLKAEYDLGITAKYNKPADTSDENYIKEIKKLYDTGFDFIITPGFLFNTAVSYAQYEYPDAKFVVIDAAPDFTASNTVSVFFAEHESGFLAGAAAALQLKEGEMGFIGGMEITPVQKFNWGFQQGINYANKELGTRIVMNTENVVYQGTFNDEAGGQKLAGEIFDRGVDAIFCAAGGVGNGVIAEARSRAKAGEKVWIIGVDFDQYEAGIYAGNKSVILTSALKKYDVAAYKMVERELDGSFPGGESIILDVGDNAVGIPFNNPNLDFIVEEKIREILEMIKSGDIVISDVRGDLIR